MDINLFTSKYTIEILMEDIRKRITTCWKECITLNDVEEWLKNFYGKVYSIENERMLALILLNHFIYISRTELMHLCRVIHYEYLHTLAIRYPNYQAVYSQTTFYPIGNPSESSSLVLYFFRIANEIATDKFDYYPIYSKSEEKIVFVDDTSMTGEQAFNYITKCISQNKEIHAENVFYLTLVGTELSKKKFESHGINYIASCYIDTQMELFSSDSYTFFSSEESELIKTFLNGYEKEVDWFPLGYGNLGIAFGFYYNVPDNSLPIFWRDSEKWSPIFKRFHKIYKSKEEGEFFDDRDKFI